MRYIFLVTVTCFLFSVEGVAQKPDNILGRWMTTTNNLIVQVYSQNGDYKAKILWFKDVSNEAMNSRLDINNPDKNLRSRKWIGMDVLRNLRYDADNNEWSDGIIYDAKHGKEWDSVAWLTSDNLLKVKGYWVFKFISEILTFKRI